jgi:2-haloacid dehalogenase
MPQFKDVKALTFDAFGTILDLKGSLIPFISEFLKKKQVKVAPEKIWDDWRARQRIEQFQDTIMMVGHSGYLETSRRACVYTLALHGISASPEEVKELMGAWQYLSPFPEVAAALPRLKKKYRLVVVSNGEPDYLAHLVKDRIRFDFEKVISVEIVGAFKPHPAVYRRAALMLGLEVGECMMISANSFDVVGARACGLQAAFVNRNKLPYDDTPYKPQIVVNNFTELAEALA